MPATFPRAPPASEHIVVPSTAIIQIVLAQPRVLVQGFIPLESAPPQNLEDVVGGISHALLSAAVLETWPGVTAEGLGPSQCHALGWFSAGVSPSSKELSQCLCGALVLSIGLGGNSLGSGVQLVPGIALPSLPAKGTSPPLLAPDFLLMNSCPVASCFLFEHGLLLGPLSPFSLSGRSQHHAGVPTEYDVFSYGKNPALIKVSEQYDFQKETTALQGRVMLLP